MTIALAIGACIVVLVFIYAISRFFKRSRKISSPDRVRSRTPRLGIVDAFDLGDRQRQLVLLRRDNIEHLLLIGGPNDVVVESNIVRNLTLKPHPVPGEIPADHIQAERFPGVDRHPADIQSGGRPPRPHIPQPANAALQPPLSPYAQPVVSGTGAGPYPAQTAPVFPSAPMTPETDEIHPSFPVQASAKPVPPAPVSSASVSPANAAFPQSPSPTEPLSGISSAGMTSGAIRSENIPTSHVGNPGETDVKKEKKWLKFSNPVTAKTTASAKKAAKDAFSSNSDIMEGSSFNPDDFVSSLNPDDFDIPNLDQGVNPTGQPASSLTHSLQFPGPDRPQQSNLNNNAPPASAPRQDILADAARQLEAALHQATIPSSAPSHTVARSNPDIALQKQSSVDTSASATMPWETKQFQTADSSTLPHPSGQSIPEIDEKLLAAIIESMPPAKQPLAETPDSVQVAVPAHTDKQPPLSESNLSRNTANHFSDSENTRTDTRLHVGEPATLTAPAPAAQTSKTTQTEVSHTAPAAVTARPKIPAADAPSMIAIQQSAAVIEEVPQKKPSQQIQTEALANQSPAVQPLEQNFTNNPDIIHNSEPREQISQPDSRSEESGVTAPSQSSSSYPEDSSVAGTEEISSVQETGISAAEVPAISQTDSTHHASPAVQSPMPDDNMQAAKSQIKDPFSVEEIQAEFARLLGRPVSK